MSNNKLQICQNKLIRSVLKLDRRCHITPAHFKSLNWLPVEEMVIQLKLSHVKRIMLGTAPSYMSEGYVLANDSHHQATQFSQTTFCQILASVFSKSNVNYFFPNRPLMAIPGHLTRDFIIVILYIQSCGEHVNSFFNSRYVL